MDGVSRLRSQHVYSAQLIPFLLFVQPPSSGLIHYDNLYWKGRQLFKQRNNYQFKGKRFNGAMARCCFQNFSHRNLGLCGPLVEFPNILRCTVRKVELRGPGRSCSGEKSFFQQVIGHSLLVDSCIWWTSRTKINPEFIMADSICLGGIVTCGRTEEIFPALFVKALPLKFKLWKRSLFF